MNSILFYIIGFILFFPLIIFRSIFLKIPILIYAYPIWIMSGYMLGLPPSRIILNIGVDYYSNYYKVAFIYAFISYFVFLSAIWSIRKKDYNFSILKLNYVVRFILFIILVIFMAIAYPKAFGLSTHRFGMMGGIVVYLMSMFILTSNNKHIFHQILNLFFILTLLFVILRGERADFLLSLFAFYFFIKRTSLVSFKYFIFIIFVIFSVGLISGYLRAGKEFNFDFFIKAIPILITQVGTVIDVIHIYYSSIWYYFNKGINIDVWLNVLFSYFPILGEKFKGVSSVYNFSNILRYYIFNLGGGLFYSVGIMSGGLLGIIFISYLYGYILKKLFLLRGISSILFISFFILQFRLQWYGITYYSTPFILGLFTILIFKLKPNILKRKVIYGR